MKKVIFMISFLCFLAISLNAQNKVNAKNADNKKEGSSLILKVNKIEEDTVANKSSIKILKIWPNPAVEKIQIDYEGKSDIQYIMEIYDIKGNLLVPKNIIYNYSQKNIIINDLSNFTVGHYEFRLSGGGESTTGSFKIIK